MTPLIRPLLFAVARLGLFLAVTVWIVGHRVEWFSALCPVPSGSTGFIVRSETCTFGYAQHAIPVKWYTANDLDGSNATWHRRVWAEVKWRGYSLEVPNWLVTSVFLAFNVVLHFTYRKRPETQPCEN